MIPFSFLSDQLFRKILVDFWGFKCRFAHPYLAFMMFIPCALVGLLIPIAVWGRFPLSQDVSSQHTSKEVAIHSEILN